jgi:hypothetical protein
MEFTSRERGSPAAALGGHDTGVSDYSISKPTLWTVDNDEKNK